MLPHSLAPQLCTLVTDVAGGDDWLHEIKYDGWRLLARKDGDGVRLFTRGGVEWSARLPKLTAAIRQLHVRNAWLDGELVYLDEHGYPRFERVLSCVRSSEETALYFQVWDLMWRDGRSLTDRPLLERKQALADALSDGSPRVRFTSHVVGEGAAFFRAADAHDVEGIVSKRVDSRYHAGRRTRDWLKVKCWRQYRLLVGGVERDDEGRLAALLVGSPDGDRLRYEGRVELGLHRLYGVRTAWLDGRAAADSPFRDGPSARGRVWLDPNVAITVRALPRAAGEPLRHAVAIGVSQVVRQRKG
jgi:bifunctional non-homologous end joining protein LigD